MPLIICSGGGVPVVQGGGGGGSDYVSVYPPQQNDTYVKATTTYEGEWYYPYFATNPTTSLIGRWDYNSWLTPIGVATNQRFHIDLGTAQIVKRIYYENQHDVGVVIATEVGVKNFTFWGSNTAGDFADLVYANNGTWVQITAALATFDQHIAADQPDPKYILVTNTTAYRYYAFKFADNWGWWAYMGVRRIELQKLV